MLSEEKIENAKQRISKAHNDICFGTLYSQEENEKDEKILLQYIEQLESDKQKIIEKLEDKIMMVEKCYQDLIKPYYDEQLKIINTSVMSKKEKEEFINKRNCLLVQKATLEEVLKMIKREKK